MPVTLLLADLCSGQHLQRDSGRDGGRDGGRDSGRDGGRDGGPDGARDGGLGSRRGRRGVSELRSSRLRPRRVEPGAHERIERCE